MLKNKYKYDLLTIGGATRDITFYSDEGKIIDNRQDLTRQKLLAFEYGAKIKIDQSYFSFGGGANNVAVGTSKLGLKTVCLIRIGRDENGRQIFENLRKNKIATRFLQIDRQLATGFSFIVCSEKTSEHTAFLFRGANNNLEVSQSELKKIKPKWIYLSSLSGMTWRKILDSVFIFSEKYRLAWNPGSQQLKAGVKGLKKYLKKTAVLILNKDEAIEMVLSAGLKTQNVRVLLEKLFELGPKIVVITCGIDGAYVYDGKKIYYKSGSRTKGKDTTGAGDAFSSGFLSGFIPTENIQKALDLASKNSQAVLGQVGAQNGLLNLKTEKHSNIQGTFKNSIIQ